MMKRILSLALLPAILVGLLLQVAMPRAKAAPSASTATVENCYNTGSVGGNGTAAGIVGYYSGSAANTVVKNCYNTGRTAYGIVHSASADATGSVTDCLSLDTMEAVGETPLSCTLQYSDDTYGNNKTGSLLTLCKALFAYSDSAKSYFAP